VDGVVFVADSQEARMDANIESLRNLKENLKEHGVAFDKVPYVLQINKRDLPSAVPLPEIEKALRLKDEPVFEAVASRGTGVFETLKAVVKSVLMDLNTR
jgi:signal recognition particle receptor subunit beta